MPTPPRGIDAVLADHLRATGLTHTAIAYRLGMSRQALTDRMRGRTPWTTTEVPVVCQLVGVAVGDAYRDAEAREVVSRG